MVVSHLDLSEFFRNELVFPVSSLQFAGGLASVAMSHARVKNAFSDIRLGMKEHNPGVKT